MDEQLLDALRSAQEVCNEGNAHATELMEQAERGEISYEEADSERFDIWEASHDTLAVLLAAFEDQESSASRQHFIDTGRYLFKGEVES